VGELQLKIAASLQAKSNKGNKDTIQDLCNWSRLWKINPNYESIEDINSKVYATDGDSDQLPIEVHGEVLPRHFSIDQINVADGEILVNEIMLDRDSKARVKYCLEMLSEQNKNNAKPLNNN